LLSGLGKKGWFKPALFDGIASVCGQKTSGGWQIASAIRNPAELWPLKV